MGFVAKFEITKIIKNGIQMSLVERMLFSVGLKIISS